MKKATILLLLIFSLIILFLLIGPFVLRASDTCPQDGGWTKIDSNDLSLYPVAGATEYCFKAGSDNSQGCTGGIFSTWPQPEGTCGLSHWAYYVPYVVPTLSISVTPMPTINPSRGPGEVTPSNLSPAPSNTPIITSIPPTGVQPTGIAPSPTPTISTPKEGPRTGRGK